MRVEQSRFNKDLDNDSVKVLESEFRCESLETGSVKVGILFSGDDYVLVLSPDGKQVLRVERKYIGSEKWRNDMLYDFSLACSNQ